MATVPKLHVWKQLYFAVFSLAKYELSLPSRLVRKPIKTVANLFGFSPAPLSIYQAHFCYTPLWIRFTPLWYRSSRRRFLFFSQLMLLLFFEELEFATVTLIKHSSGVLCCQQTMSQKLIIYGKISPSFFTKCIFFLGNVTISNLNNVL